ncbi:MAG: 2-C-methyl-D-erythritol 4-phosphate cytidylyltransferase [Kiritimatiellae bacterium]|nr:2-C-methyl-D-erythritol 4-phosphate cytidylyltransferase [Kiritimatiellia bacterium]
MKIENIALIFAGGSGTRMGAPIPKQFLEIGGKPVLAHTLELFQRHPEIDGIVLVTHPDHFDRTRAICRDCGIEKLVDVCEGGQTAQDSIYAGLRRCAALYPGETVVLVHDGVRPYVTDETISRNIAAVREFGSAVTIVPCYETVVVSSDGAKIDSMPKRGESYVAQAPQGFRLADILDAHERIRRRPGKYEGLVDQATICFALGMPVHLVDGCRGNIKVTTPEDLVTLSALMEWRRANG